MLNRVSAALAQFIKPIASSKTADRQPRGQTGGSFKKFEPKQEAQVIPFPARKEEEPASESAIPPPPPPTASVASSFIQLMEFFRERRGNLFQRRGMSAYRDSEASSKKGRYRKGAVVDQKVGT